MFYVMWFGGSTWSWFGERAVNPTSSHLLHLICPRETDFIHQDSGTDPTAGHPADWKKSLIVDQEDEDVSEDLQSLLADGRSENRSPVFSAAPELQDRADMICFDPEAKSRRVLPSLLLSFQFRDSLGSLDAANIHHSSESSTPQHWSHTFRGTRRLTCRHKEDE
ncbi:hypothetical protein SRHO_G00189860 [Serrasalmus rhombeus]